MQHPARSRFAALVLTVLLLAVPASAEDAMIGYVKFKPLKTLGEKVDILMDAFVPNPESAMGIRMMLAGSGYPAFAGVSSTAPVTLFILESDDPMIPMGYVLVGQFELDSSVGNMLTLFEMSVVEDSGWVLAGPSEVLASISDIQSLLAIAAKAATHDITLYLSLDNMAEPLRFRLEDLAFMMGEETDEAVLPYESWLTLLTDQVDQMSAVQLDLDIASTSISKTFSIEAKPGTSLAALFNQTVASTPVPAAALVGAEGMLAYQGRYNVAATQAWWDELMVAIKAAAGPSSADSMDRFNATLEPLWAMGDGSFAANLSYVPPVDDETLPDYLHGIIYGMTPAFDMAVYLDALDALYGQILSAVSRWLKAQDAEMDGLPVEVVIFRDDYTEQGVAVHRVEVNLDEAFIARMNAFTEEGMTQTTSIEELLDQQTNYFAFANGYLINTTSREQMVTLIQAVLAGKPVENNVGAVLPALSGALMNYQLDLKTYALLLVDATENPFLTGFDEARAALGAVSIPSVSGDMRGGNNRLTVNSVIPIEGIKAIREAMSHIRFDAESFMMQMEEGDFAE